MPTPVIHILRAVENMGEALDGDVHAAQAGLALGFVFTEAEDVEVGAQNGQWRAVFVGDEVDELAFTFVQFVFALNVLDGALGVFQCLAMGLAEGAVALAKRQMQCNDEAQRGDLQVVLQGVKGRINAHDVQNGEQKTEHAKQVGNEQQAAACVFDAPEAEREPKADTRHQQGKIENQRCNHNEVTRKPTDAGPEGQHDAKPIEVEYQPLARSDLKQARIEGKRGSDDKKCRQAAQGVAEGRAVWNQVLRSETPVADQGHPNAGDKDQKPPQQRVVQPQPGNKVQHHDCHQHAENANQQAVIKRHGRMKVVWCPQAWHKNRGAFGLQAQVVSARVVVCQMQLENETPVVHLARAEGQLVTGAALQKSAWVQRVRLLARPLAATKRCRLYCQRIEFPRTISSASTRRQTTTQRRRRHEHFPQKVSRCHSRCRRRL